MAFESKELMFSVVLEKDDAQEEHAVLQVEGCGGQSVKFVFGSCWTTQKWPKTTKCKAGPGKFRVAGADGLKELKVALSQMLKELRPMEKELRAFEAAEAKATKASVKTPVKASAKKAAKAPAKNAAKAPAKKAAKKPAKKAAKSPAKKTPKPPANKD